jgi:hypothetical protein
MKFRCSNCGYEITKEQVFLALEDAGEDPLLAEASDHYSFCCPTYTDQRGCQGTAQADADEPAYWILRY